MIDTADCHTASPNFPALNIRIYKPNFGSGHGICLLNLNDGFEDINISKLPNSMGPEGMVIYAFFIYPKKA